MSQKDIETNDALSAFLEGGGSYLAALSAILKTEDAKLQKAAKKDTVQARKDKLREAVARYDVDTLVQLHDRLEGYVDKMFRPVVTAPRKLTEDEVKAAYTEFLERRDLAELFGVRYEDLRTLVLMSIDEALREQGKDPEVTNGELPVPGTDKVFRKEGAGRKDPDLDERKLLEMLGDRAAEVQDEVFIPAHTETVLNREKLMRLAQQQPEVMEMIRDSLIPGEVKSPRLNLRDVK